MTTEDTSEKQEAYQRYRRGKVLVSSIYQAKQCIHNISSYSRYDLWPEEDQAKIVEILGRCKVLLENISQLERKIEAVTQNIPLLKSMHDMEKEM